MLCLTFFLFQAVNNYSDFTGIFLFKSAIRWFIDARQLRSFIGFHFLMLTYETSANEENINNRN